MGFLIMGAGAFIRRASVSVTGMILSGKDLISTEK
jgi:hypothetical protein